MAITFEKSLACSLWDQEFWMDMAKAETDARNHLALMREQVKKEGGCMCDTCIVNNVLETVWPTLTECLIRAKESRVDEG